MLMMMGSAEALPSVPTERPKFIEDMTEAEAASAVSQPREREKERGELHPNSTWLFIPWQRMITVYST